MTKDEREQLKEEFIKKEFTHWSSKLSEFVRLPDSCKNQVADYWLDLIEAREKETTQKIKFLESALDYIALIANIENPHLGRPRSSDVKCIFCLAYLALNDGAYGEHFEYAEMAQALRELRELRNKQN